MLRKNRVVALVMMTSLIGSACTDITAGLTPEGTVNQSRRSADGRETIRRQIFACRTTDLHTTDGHAYRLTDVALHFPASELPADGGTQAFRLRVRVPGQAAVAAANCRIPNTRAAAERLYRTFARIFRKRAVLEPLVFAPARESDLYIPESRVTGAAPPAGPKFDTNSSGTIPGVTVTVSAVPEGGATGWTGTTDWEWGWGSQGDTYTYSGGDSPEPAPAEAIDGPVLALILCLGGLLMGGYTIDDVADQTKALVTDKLRSDGDSATYAMYLQQPDQENTMRYYLQNQAQASHDVYINDVHNLATKLNVSEATVFLAIVGCGVALAAPTP